MSPKNGLSDAKMSELDHTNPYWNKGKKKKWVAVGSDGANHSFRFRLKHFSVQERQQLSDLSGGEQQLSRIAFYC